MNISNSVLETYLSNVFWIGGGSCGGKTTVTDMLAEKHGFVPYHAEEHVFSEHCDLANETDHPAMSRKATLEEVCLTWSVETHAQWLQATFDEQLEMVVLDVVRLSESRQVVADMSCSPGLLKRIAVGGQHLCLYADEPTVRASFFARDDRKRVADAIGALSRPDEVSEKVLQVVLLMASRTRAQAEEAGLVCIDRADTKNAEDMQARVEAYFGL